MKASDRTRRFNAMTEIGCVVCLMYKQVHTEPEIHHLRGHPWSGEGQRATDENTIPLCPAHHRTGAPGEPGYHDSPKDFEAKFGTQGELLESTNELIETLEKLKGSA